MTPSSTLDSPRRWRPSPLIWLTLLLHAAILPALLIAPQHWRWVVAAILADHLVLTLAGLWPRSDWLGPNWTRLRAASAARGEIALTIDDGPNPEVTPQVLEILDRYRVKASFFCIGDKAQRYPELCRRIIERGHSIENHSQHHRHYFSLMGPAGLAREIQSAQQTLTAITGQAPLFFRAPAGLRNPFLDPVLARVGLLLAAWTRRGFDTRTTDPDIVRHRLLQDLKAGTILLLHDGNCARTPAGVPMIVAVLPALLDAAVQAKLHFVTLPAALKTSQP